MYEMKTTHGVETRQILRCQEHSKAPALVSHTCTGKVGLILLLEGVSCDAIAAVWSSLLCDHDATVLATLLVARHRAVQSPRLQRSGRAHDMTHSCIGACNDHDDTIRDYYLYSTRAGVCIISTDYYIRSSCFVVPFLYSCKVRVSRACARRVSHFPGCFPRGNQTVAKINQKVGDLPLKWYLPLLVNTSCELCDATRARCF